jgi:hypothetical protein
MTVHSGEEPHCVPPALRGLKLRLDRRNAGTGRHVTCSCPV